MSQPTQDPITDAQWETINERIKLLHDQFKRYIPLALTHMPNRSTLVRDLTADGTPENEIRELYTALSATIWNGLNSWKSGRRSRNESRSGTDTPRSQASVRACLERDNNQCVITGRHIQIFPVEVAHIIPHSLGSNRNHIYWKFLEIFLGQDATNDLWEFLGGDHINRLENLFLLDASIHRLFDRHIIDLEPVPSLSTAHKTVVLFRWHGNSQLVPNVITTTVGVLAGQPAVSVSDGHCFVISGFSNPTNPIPVLPDTRLFELSRALNAMSREIGAAAETDPAGDGNDPPDMEYAGLATAWDPYCSMIDDSQAVDPIYLSQLLSEISVSVSVCWPYFNSIFNSQLI